MHYTYEDIKSRLQSIVDRAGDDFIYTQRSRKESWVSGCEYAWRGQPDCGIGHLLVELGVPVGDLGEGQEFDSEIIGAYASKLDRDYNITFGTKALDLMVIFQADQDNGMSWGDALKAGINYVETGTY